MTISDRIFEILKEKGITQREFSKRTGIPQSTISDWKGKKLNPSADKLMIICQVLEIQSYELLSGTESQSYTLPDVVIVNRNSEEYMLIERFQQLNEKSRHRLLGYLDALEDQEDKG